MPSAPILSILLLSSAALAAQTSAPVAQFIPPTPALVQSCPVTLTVDRRPQAAIVEAGNFNGPNHGQRLSISILMSSNPILAADVDVHGYDISGRIFPATTRSPREVVETFHLTGSASDPITRYALRTRQIAAVKRIELTRIEYADGTTWQASALSRCSASPSLLVLVNSAH